MEDPKRETVPIIKAGQFRLTQAMAEVISAADGKVLAERMRAVVASASYQTLAPEQQRALVREALQRK